MISTRSRIAFAALLLMICCVWAGRSAHSQTAKNAPEVFAKMLATYEHAGSYEDNGEMRVLPNAKSILDDNTRRAKPLVLFRTFFEKPQLFRFDWLNRLTKTSRESAIWSDGQEHCIWALDRVTPDDRFNFERKRDFDFLVDRAVKPSNGTILTIPGLLIPTLRPYTFADVIRDLSEAKIIKEQFVDGEMCYVISAKASNDPWVFWIGKRSFLLRKMRSVLASGSFDEGRGRRPSKRVIAEEVHRHIEINRTVDPEVFHYKPRILARDTDLTKEPL